jgi:hypothetical protein
MEWTCNLIEVILETFENKPSISKEGRLLGFKASNLDTKRRLHCVKKQICD